MIKKSSALFLSVLALLPLAANTAEAGRRNVATQKPSVSSNVTKFKWSLFDFTYWAKGASSWQSAGNVVRTEPVAVPAQPAAAAPALAVAAAPPVAQGPPGGPRRIKGANPVVLLLVPKPVFSNP
jgi:hypothetical protein